MPVPLSVMQAAAQGDKKAMRLVEQEYGVGNGRRYAENFLSEEEPPPRVPTGVKGIKHPTRYESRYEYSLEGEKQVREAEAKALAEKISRLKKQSDMQDVLLKVAGEDYALARDTATLLKIGGGAALGAAGGVGGFAKIGVPVAEAAIGGSAQSVPGAFFGLMSKGPSDLSANKANKEFADIELSPEAQTIYDEYKAKGYSPTYYKTK